MTKCGCPQCQPKRKYNERYLFPPSTIQLSEAASLDRICHVYTDMAGNAIMVSETSPPRRLKYETPPWLQEVIDATEPVDDLVRSRLREQGSLRRDKGDWENPNPWKGYYDDIPW
jgi:hypothetical protein